MSFKPPMQPPPMAVRNAVNQPKSRDNRAPIKGAATRAVDSKEAPIKNSIQRKHRG